MPEYLTVHELAVRWRYDTDKPVYKLKKKIGFVEIGGKIMFDLNDVLRYETANKITPEPEEDADGNAE